MTRPGFFASATVLLLSLPLFAKDQRAVHFDQSGTNIVQAPEQLRRVPPPSLTASPQELEAQADQLRAQKNFVDALDYYKAAMRSGDSAVLENKVGITELSLFHLDEAKKKFEKAVKLDHSYAEAANNLGVVFYIKRNYKKAIKEYQHALTDRPDSASFHSNLGSAYFAKKEFDKASAEYMAAMQIDPEIFMRQSESGISAKLGSPEDRAKFHFTIAKVFAKRGDADNCILYLRKAIEDGFPTIDDVYKEAEFKPFLKDPRLVTLMASKPEAVK